MSSIGAIHGCKIWQGVILCNEINFVFTWLRSGEIIHYMLYLPSQAAVNFEIIVANLKKRCTF